MEVPAHRGRSPKLPHSKLIEDIFVAAQSEAPFDCLSDEDPVEGVPVGSRQMTRQEGVLDRDCQRLKLLLRQLFGEGARFPARSIRRGLEGRARYRSTPPPNPAGSPPDRLRTDAPSLGSPRTRRRDGSQVSLALLRPKEGPGPEVLD